MTELLAKLRTVWPPSLNDVGTGYKIKQADYTGATIVETLDDLHEHGWWTGLKIVVGGVEDQREFLVTLVDKDGVLSTLRVMSGEIQPFQWALPAHVATARSIQIHVVPVLSDPIPYVNMISYFYDMPPMDPTTTIHFIMDNYSIAFSYSPDTSAGAMIIPTMLKLYQ